MITHLPNRGCSSRRFPGKPGVAPRVREDTSVSSIPDPISSRRGLLISASASGLAFIAQLGVAFILAPMMLHYLGRERYGVWSFVESFLAYFTLFDLGISSTLVR